MIIKNSEIKQINWNGLKIYDYTSEKNLSSSLAYIIVPPGKSHRKTLSNRSDKFYFIISGKIHFIVNEKEFILSERDCCIIQKGETFFYRNKTNKNVKLLLIHTPCFKLDSEVFLD
ncbi:MAG: cupin domain-containing protein [Candidatus Lokiarchaeota archaeon]|nr:cupin domain-containing protein [Candidatus Lokiarchaeota archaeon]